MTVTEEQDRDTKVTIEPESPMHGLLLAEVDTIHKSEEESGNNALPYPRDNTSGAEKEAQFIVVVASGDATLAASDANSVIEDHQEPPKDKNSSEIGEVLAPKSAQAQPTSHATLLLWMLVKRLMLVTRLMN